MGTSSEADREYQRARRQQRIENGLCDRCGKRPPVPGNLKCEPCREYYRQRAKYELTHPIIRARRDAYQKQWIENNRDRSRERARIYLYNLRNQLLDHYGRECVCCGETNAAFLTFDHIMDDGKSHRLAVNSVYRDLRKRGFPPIVQTMCWNCNQAKRIYGICPHRKSAAD